MRSFLKNGERRERSSIKQERRLHEGQTERDKMSLDRNAQVQAVASNVGIKPFTGRPCVYSAERKKARDQNGITRESKVGSLPCEALIISSYLIWTSPLSIRPLN